jgi:hypothetical protein
LVIKKFISGIIHLAEKNYALLKRLPGSFLLLLDHFSWKAGDPSRRGQWSSVIPTARA